MKIIELSTLLLIVAPFGSGKTSLLRYIITQLAEQIVCLVIFSNTGLDQWKEGYSFVNQKYVYDKFNENTLENLKKLGKRIKTHSPDKHLVCIFDDS